MQSLLRLKPYLKPYLWHIVVSGLLAIPLSAIRTGPAPVVKYMLDEVLVRKNSSNLVYFSLALVGLYGVNFVVRFLHYYLLRIVVVRVNQKLKSDLYRHLMGLSADYYTTQSTGTLISRSGVDPQYIDGGLSCINVVIREPLTLIFLFGYTFYLNWQLTVITLIVFPMLAWVFSATGRNLKRYISRITEVNARLYSILQESYTGIRIIKTFGLEDFFFKRFTERSEQTAHLLLKTSLLEETAHPMVELLTALALAPVIYYGGLQVLHGKMTPGDLFAFFTSFAMMMNPIRMLNDVNMKLHQAAAACDRVFEVFEWKSRLQESKNPRSIKTIEHRIELQNVSFCYPDEPSKAVIKNLNLEIQKGQVIGLVGASGAGKSSLVSLLPRIFDVTSGRILIDGVDIREIVLPDLRKLMAVVSQDIFLINDTVEENIRCGKLGASAAEIRRAAERAHALEFIDKLPEGFQTIIGDRGQKLSGGQRQRLSIARAFLREAPILILDEATSSLDSTSEKEVQGALEELMVDRTTLMIAHRLSSIRHADTIFVIKDGEIVEEGDHARLLGLRGEYFRFHENHVG